MSHWTALHLHTLARQGLIAPMQPSPTTSLKQATSLLSEAMSSAILQDLAQKRPLDIMVANRASSFSTTKTKPHLVSVPCIPGSILEYGGIYVASPALALTQVISSVSPVKRLPLIMEYTGRYSTFPDFSSYDAQPATSLKELESIVRAMKGAQGVGIMRRLLPYVHENAASPMETALVLMLSLPAIRGGYGFEPPQLNAEVKLTPHAARIAGKATCYCDLFWPQDKVALEYDSREFHEGLSRHGQDTARALALSTMGIEVQSVTYLQLGDLDQLDVIAKKLARRMGKRWRAGSARVLNKRHELLQALLHQQLYTDMD